MAPSPSRPPLVFDLGSTSVRCGFANSAAEIPKLTIPSLVAYPRNQQLADTNMNSNNNNSNSASASTNINVNNSNITVYCGLDAVRMRAVSTMKHPIRDGHIANLQDFRLLLTSVCDIFSNVLPETSCVVTEPAFAPKSFRQEVAALLFDLRAPSVLFASQGLTSLFAVGELSGLILDVGEHSSRAIAAVDGIGIPSTSASTSIGGEAVTGQMIGVLQDSGQSRALDYAPQIKEALCEVAVDTEAARNALLTKGATRDFALPDSQTIRVSSSERFRCPEVLFASNTASGIGGSATTPMSIAQIVEESLYSCDEVVRPHLLPRIHYCGATTAMKGFEARLLHELRRPRGFSGSSSNNNNSILSDSDRLMFSIPSASSLKGCRVHPCDRTWAGAAIFGSLTSTSQLFTTQKDYQEQGAGALSRFRQLAA